MNIDDAQTGTPLPQKESNLVVVIIRLPNGSRASSRPFKPVFPITKEQLLNALFEDTEPRVTDLFLHQDENGIYYANNSTLTPDEKAALIKYNESIIKKCKECGH